MNSVRTHLLRRVGWLSRRRSLMETVAVSVGMLVLGLALSIMTARALGPEGRGVFSLALTISALVSLVSGLGLQQALAYHLARDPGRAREGLGLSLGAGAIVGGAVALVGGLLTARFADETARVAIILGLLAVSPSLVAGNLLGILQGLQQIRKFNLLRFAAPACTTLLVAVWFVAGGLTASAAVGMQLAGVVAAAVLAWMLVHPRVRIRVPEKRWTCDVLRYGAVVNLAAVAYAANRQLSVLVLAAVGTLEDVGVYAVAVGYAMVVTIVPTAIALLALPRVASEADPLTRARLARRQLGQAWLGTLPLAGGLMLAAPVLIPLAFGDEFRDSVTTARLLAVAMAFLGLSHVLSEICRGMGRPVFPAIAEAGALVANLGFLIVVVPRYGVEGAAAVALGAYGLVCLMLFLVVHSMLRSPS